MVLIGYGCTLGFLPKISFTPVFAPLSVFCLSSAVSREAKNQETRSVGQEFFFSECLSHNSYLYILPHTYYLYLTIIQYFRVLKLLGPVLIKINTVSANSNNARPLLILSNLQNLQALASCESLGHDIHMLYIKRNSGWF